MTVPRFVLAWAVEDRADLKPLGRGGRLLLVEHPERGWELPGGRVEPGESPEEAMHRELFEETGRGGQILAWNKDYYDEGWLAVVLLDKSKAPVCDPHVARTTWWTEVPPMVEWDPQEFSDLGVWVEAFKGEGRHAGGPP